MDMIELARELGRQLQKDERYLAFNAARVASDEDQELQDLIGEFNLKRMAINNEAQKEERDDEKIQRLNVELREVYNRVMNNENMMKYNESKQALDECVQRVLTIISMCAEGEDPDTADYDPSACTHDCSTCGGCH